MLLSLLWVATCLANIYSFVRCGTSRSVVWAVYCATMAILTYLGIFSWPMILLGTVLLLTQISIKIRFNDRKAEGTF